MRRAVCAFAIGLLATPVAAQSVYLGPGQHAVLVGAGWSTGPSSHGVESEVAVGFGRVDVGASLSRYTLTLDDGTPSRWNEYAPFARVFVVKETDGAPVSLSVSGQYFADDFELNNSGHYVQFSTTVYKTIRAGANIAIQPFGGFGVASESYCYGGGDLQRSTYLTRDLGLSLSTAPDRPWMVLVTLRDQAFRTDSYRSARLSVVRKF
jgi:hypothetical protein